MAMTQLALLFMGALATLATVGMFVNLDDASRILVSFSGAILWAFFGMSAFDVYVDEAATKSEPITPLAYLGIGFAVIVGLFAFYTLIDVVRAETEATDPEDMLS